MDADGHRCVKRRELKRKFAKQRMRCESTGVDRDGRMLCGPQRDGWRGKESSDGGWTN
jgi:hypothetical protein